MTCLYRENLESFWIYLYKKNNNKKTSKFCCISAWKVKKIEVKKYIFPYIFECHQNSSKCSSYNQLPPNIKKGHLKRNVCKSMWKEVEWKCKRSPSIQLISFFVSFRDLHSWQEVPLTWWIMQPADSVPIWILSAVPSPEDHPKKPNWEAFRSVGLEIPRQGVWNY